MQGEGCSNSVRELYPGLGDTTGVSVVLWTILIFFFSFHLSSFERPLCHFSLRFELIIFFALVHYTAGDDGSVGIISCMSIFSACFGLLASVQLAATTWSGQIWISVWILPHFDVKTISVAWKLKKFSNIFLQKIFFLLHPLSKGVAPLCNPRHTKTGKAKDRQITIKWSSLFLQYYIIRVEINLQCTSQYVT